MPNRAAVVVLVGEQWEAAQATCTDRQLQCLDLWRRGWGYKAIGLMIDLHPTTVKAHVEAGLRHLGYSVGHFHGLR